MYSKKTNTQIAVVLAIRNVDYQYQCFDKSLENNSSIPRVDYNRYADIIIMYLQVTWIESSCMLNGSKSVLKKAATTPGKHTNHMLSENISFKSVWQTVEL